MAQGKGNGNGNGGGGDPPPPPTTDLVQYQVTWLDAPADWGPDWETNAYDINESATIVGNAFNDVTGEQVAVMYVGGVAVDLNFPDATWTDLADGSHPDNWIATKARNVNENDQIVGYATNSDTLMIRPYIFDLTSSSFVLLPEVAGQTDPITSIAIDINDEGVVVCGIESEIAWLAVVYSPFTTPMYQPQVLNGVTSPYLVRINNMGIVAAGSGHVVIPGTDYDYAPGTAEYRHYDNIRIDGIQDNGTMICGGRYSSGRGKNKDPGGPMRQDLVTGAEERLGTGLGWARDINCQGDTVIFISGEGIFLHADVTGLVLLNDLVVNDDAFDGGQPFAITDSNPITDPDNTTFGAICGISTPGLVNRAYVLFPETYVPPGE